MSVVRGRRDILTRSHSLATISLSPLQIEDLSQQAQMAAAEKFKAPEPSLAGRTAEPIPITPALAEESDDEEVSGGFY